ncbi:MAG: TonB-dependent receptor [Terracidiphilus sp.]|nr:TonB-dependent receptor [Terracidiphilus sp.]
MIKFRNLNFQQFLTALVLAVAFCVTCTGVSAVAQTAGAGAITGSVTDSAQAVIPGAAITVTNIDNGIAHAYTTNAAGIYQAPFLTPGHYKVSASASNFGKVEAQNLTLQVGQTLTINLTLTVKSDTTTVEVSGTNSILDVEQTEVSQVVDSPIIQNLPVNGRNWSDFVLLTPNVVADGSTGLVSFHGISGLYNQNYVDGANNNQMLNSEARGRSSGAPFVYSLDSIKEFQAEASNYSAEFGQAAGGQVNAITKSGTENLHGDLFYYLRYPDMNALDPYSKWLALNSHGPSFLLTQPIHQQNEFGGSVGGPIVKNKLFYFLTYDGFRKVGRVLYYENDNVSLTPTGTYGDSTNITPTQCPATISSTQCTNAIKFLQSLQGAPSRFQKESLFFPRLDYQLNAKNLVYANFNFADFDSTNGYAGNPTYSNTSASTNGPTSYHERFLVAHWTSTLSDTAVNDLRFQWGRDFETMGANSAGPSIGMGAESYGMPNALPRSAMPDEHRWQFTDVFSKVWNRHTLKFGGDINLVHEVMINLYQGGGLYSYTGSDTVKFQSWAADAFAGQTGDTDPYAGSHYHSFVQTVDKINSVASGRAGADDFWMKMYDGFAEDSWKVSQKLTVNLGVRYDFQQTPSPAKPNTSSALAIEYNTTIKNVADRVQPRIGFSWNLFPGTVLRGGYGIFTGLNQGGTYYAMRVENGVYQVNYNYSGCDATCTAAAALTFPNVAFAAPGPSLSTALHPTGGNAPTVAAVGGTASVTSFHGLSPNFVPPLVHEFDLGIEEALPGKMSLSLGYVGSRGLHLPVYMDANLVGQKPNGVHSYNVTYPDGTVKLLTVPYYLPTDRINQSLSSLNAGFSVANSWYHGMAVTLRRPFDHGLEVLANYTWSKAMDDDMVSGAYGTFYGGNAVLDPNNLKAEYGRSDIDMRNRFIGTVMWKPAILESNLWMKKGIDGFTFSGTATESTGFPIVAGVSGSVPVSTSSGTLLQAEGGIYGGAMTSGSGSNTMGRPPQIQRNSQPGPGVRNIDFRITREIPIHNNVSMQLIGEAFNLLNHEIISSVNTNYSTFSSPSSKAGAACPSSTSVPAGSTFNGCITPYVPSSAYQAFGTKSSTNSTLYGPRQIQVSAKLFF